MKANSEQDGEKRMKKEKKTKSLLNVLFAGRRRRRER